MTFGKTILPYLSFTALSSTPSSYVAYKFVTASKHVDLLKAQVPHRFFFVRCLRLHLITSQTYIPAFLSCGLFIQYGLLKDDDIITYTNGIGCFLQGCYLLYFYFMTRNKRFLNKVIAIELCIIGIVVYWVQHSANSHVTKQTYVGNYCIFLNICSVAAPLFDIGKVVRNKSSESLPLPLCIACFVVCFQWMFYGYIVDDIVILVPNVIATVISILQLSLFVIYPGAPPGVFPEKYEHI
ncbi:Protein CBR-SWT-4 [Caenorhabditis briggsae]|uniref:Sugar transporter SWEET n=1 Tax=Caenorhabditis briggsae TaxID=6238 RepID=A8XSH7_CAEBR|nr:Protein CBR-SWT-4 [Caenorhabditis briggsae]CAP35819.2 Protein CBR-SWT-4 [Caenorhabditis briggsae]